MRRGIVKEYIYYFFGENPLENSNWSTEKDMRGKERNGCWGNLMC
jgi:hypothetical protein